MPEGPEVQRVLETLAPKVINKTIEAVRISPYKITMPQGKRGRQDVELFIGRMSGTRVEKLERRGKYLVFHCRNNSVPLYMVAHLGMTGAWFAVGSPEEVEDRYRKHIHVTFLLDDRSLMVYSDQRRFGWVGALTEQEYREYAPIQNMGPEAFWEDAPALFLENLRSKQAMTQPIKRLLMKPEIIAGVGNIYACETLFKAKIHPLTQPKDLSDAKIMELFGHIRETLETAVKLGGSSISNYVNSEGKKGSFQNHHKVYKKEHCPDCLTPLGNIRIDQRSSFFCPQCQTLPGRG
ncbi:bifunctional DNA-formamidopyrimidine glycosylase/DNA-(apurinic or apyrimidinic site) lyase [Brevibacillus sp. SYP-B805]|uniref:bifunctional DNA-formamidopyrimidine glycosylase/DNA-(apurinic or apyrimidinic site) lyase n=1 Tax=Brevibacillus sp. SYP-B805 TaxID=1578199 RepID=UPI0013EA0575|nr:bifunctional DNA-formamidopyrimidine glycosylase/DNA-(apurinic or apyrimidinic site) lyase [Brevibacillus sp. SYP-B805]NGQ94827.1 bifunctional DNA-formamidopyrimidine glycosylase/DNA-(apurinic or apyrimidinic site) lyase [Brevibacillus sp. SYP-B805]